MQSIVQQARQGRMHLLCLPSYTPCYALTKWSELKLLKEKGLPFPGLLECSETFYFIFSEEDLKRWSYCEPEVNVLMSLPRVGTETSIFWHFFILWSQVHVMIKDLELLTPCWPKIFLHNRKILGYGPNFMNFFCSIFLFI